MGDFEKMADDCGSANTAEVMVPPPSHVMPGGTSEYRDQLVRRYHKGAESLVQRLRDEGISDNEGVLIALIEEVFKETDNLLGNGLIATENGEIQTSSVISFKRAEVLEKAIKAVQSKQQLERESGVDVDSPQMVVIFTWFMNKVKEVFDRMELPDEQRDLFFKTLGDETENWKKELREEFEIMKSR